MNSETIILCVPFLIFILYFIHFRFAAFKALDKWANDNNIKLVNKRYCNIFNNFGPFDYRKDIHSKERIFRIVVENQSGDLKKGWICLGSPFWGLASDKIEIWWDDSLEKLGIK